VSVDLRHRDLSELKICSDLAQAAVRRLVNSSKRCLQAMDSGLSGDDSGLNNAWDEICVQVQGQQSYFWDTYLRTISDFIAGSVEDLKRYELEAIWLQTPEGEEWELEEVDQRDSNPAYAGDVVNYVCNQVLGEAANYENRAIREYLDGCYEHD
jgi:hypothetical protein